MSTERWVKVTSEAELRAGMVVRLDRDINGKLWTGMLLARGMRGLGRCVYCRDCQGWRYVGGDLNLMCAVHAIDLGVLYRLDTGLDDAAEREEGRRIYGQRATVTAKEAADWGRDFERRAR